MTWLYWTYVGVMVAGVFSFLRWSGSPKGIPQIAYRLPIAILAWSGLWHVVMALGLGSATAPDRMVHWARFLDWLVTVPLLVIALALTATYATPAKGRGLITVLAIVNFLMILAGLGAEAAASPAIRFTLYGAGVTLLAAIVALIRGPLWAVARRQPAAMAAHFRTSALLLCVVWVSFPVVWILGPPGWALLSDAVTNTVFLGLSVLMKLGWSMADVARLRGLADRGEFALRTPGRT